MFQYILEGINAMYTLNHSLRKIHIRKNLSKNHEHENHFILINTFIFVYSVYYTHMAFLVSNFLLDLN